MDPPSPNRDSVERAQRGDRKALEGLFVLYCDRLQAHVRLRLGLHFRGRIEVEDVVQETQARALDGIGRFEWRGDDSFLRWLKGISDHVVLRFAEKNRRQLVYLADEIPTADPSPSTAMRRDERFDRLEDALGCLKPDYREVVKLARLEGLRINDIAKRMHRTPKSVSHLLARALKELRETFGDTESYSLPPRSFGAGDCREDEPTKP